jgi:dihydroflavonol-4-reductase
VIANILQTRCRAGHQVVATRRAGTKVAHLEDLPIEWRDGDLMSRESLTAAFAGVEAVFHCAAAVSVKKEITKELQDANVTGTENVIEACVAARVPRLIHTSSVVAIGLTTDGVPCDESAEWNFDREGLLDAYAITKHQAENKVREGLGRLDAVIVNPTYMFGPRDARPSSGKLLVQVAHRKVPAWTPGYNNFVDVRDVARGMIQAWKRGKRGERYILGGHDMTYKAVFEEIARIAGVRPPRFGVPYAAARVMGRVGDFIEARGRDPLVNSIQIRYAFTNKFRFASNKASRELGYSFGPLEPAIRDALDWFRARQMV